MNTETAALPEDPRAERRRQHALARTALACLDLTSLNDDDTPLTIQRLCERATSNYGRAAAVCVWPRFAAQARSLLPSAVAVAAVANFPHGGSDRLLAVRDTAEIAAAGAQEVDLVLPWRELAMAEALLQAVRRECSGLVLKVILETGELNDPVLIERACRIALEGGADFLKTSTGKTARSATPEAARLMLQAIRDDTTACAHVGFKPAGGIRTVADAAIYIGLFEEVLGAAALTPERFRIGASSLLNDIESVLADAPARAAPSAAADSSY